MGVRTHTLGEDFTRSERVSRVAFSRPRSEKSLPAKAIDLRARSRHCTLTGEIEIPTGRYQQSHIEHQRHSSTDTQRTPAGMPPQPNHEDRHGTERLEQKVGSEPRPSKWITDGGSRSGDLRSRKGEAGNVIAACPGGPP